jgi:hypothetical protein
VKLAEKKLGNFSLILNKGMIMKSTWTMIYNGECDDELVDIVIDEPDVDNDIVGETHLVKSNKDELVTELSF